METDVLGHLIQIEHDAASILFDAQVEADKRTSEAHVQADHEYKLEYDTLIEKLEKDCEKKLQSLDVEHVQDFEKFKDDLHKTEKDSKNFSALFETLLFG